MSRQFRVLQEWQLFEVVKKVDTRMGAAVGEILQNWNPQAVQHVEDAATIKLSDPGGTDDVDFEIVRPWYSPSHLSSWGHGE
jgi:hypothetical protein